MSKEQAASASNVLHPVMPSSIPLPPKLELRGNLRTNWIKFKRIWKNYEIASRLNTQSSELRVATLLTCIGHDVLDIYDGLPFESDEEKTDIEKVLELLENYCIGETNEIYERYVFNKRDQQQGESFDSYVTSLRTLAKTCNFGVLNDNLIRDRIVLGLADDSTRKKLLSEPKLTLDKCINICRANETTTKQFKEITSDEISAINYRSQKATGSPRRSASRNTGSVSAQSQANQPIIQCKFCMKSHPRKKELCAAWGKFCNNCGAQNHFAGSSVCKNPQRKPAVHGVDEVDNDSDSDYFFCIESVDAISEEQCKRKIFATMSLKDNLVNFQLDCGATVNILPANEYSLITLDNTFKELKPTNKTLQMFNKTQLKPLGTVEIPVVNPKNCDNLMLEFTVVAEGHVPILGAQAIQQFKLITVNDDNIMSMSDSPANHPDILEEFHDVFEGDGKLQEKLHLQVDPTVPPVVLPVRKVPYALQGVLKEELDRLVKKGILVPVDTPTDWVSSMVVATRRNGKIRLCIDPKPLNKALKRNRYPLPLLDDLLAKLTNAKVFSVVDAKNGFWHVQLDEESSLLTTFGTPWGRFRWTRMPFGISPAPEEFQRRLDNAFQDLDGVTPIFDDTLVFGVGNTDEEAQADHDTKLKALLQRCRDKGIKLNKEKLKLRRKEVVFMGHIISADGLKPDPSKIQGINEMPSPTCKQDVKRLLGMVNYLQRFAPNLSSITAPLRDLLKEGIHFQWDAVHEQSFFAVKRIISEAPVLKFFDPNDNVEIQCDASDRGLGACLMQNGQPVAYASRSMTDTEVNYAQIEKEMLAIVFAVERFEQCVYGRPVKVQTDHKPLESIFKKSLTSAPKRLQRMLLRLQRFDLDVSYKKGTEMVLADTLSRAYQESSIQGETEKDVESINMAHYLPVKEDTLLKIQSSTETDSVLQQLKAAIRQGWPLLKENVAVCIQDYFPFRDELTLQNGLIFKGERLVIPTSLRHSILEKLHSSHIGIQGCLRRAREVLYWPGMNKAIEEYIAQCDICNSYQPKQTKEPMISHEIPSRPWQKVAIDLFQLHDKEYVITVDYYSNFFEVDRIFNKTAKEVISKVKAHFARHGIPDEVVSDNGQPFASAEFQDFADLYSFEIITSSPTYPQSNGKVENAVKTAQSLMKKAIETKKDPYLALLDWRNTPTEGINVSPAQRLFGRRTKTLLPTPAELLQPKLPEGVPQRLKELKAKQTYYYNRGARELPTLKPGDVVRIEPRNSLGKGKPWIKAEVTGQSDIRSYEVRTEDGRRFRRNRRHLRISKEAPTQEPLSLSTVPSPDTPDQPATVQQDPGRPEATQDTAVTDAPVVTRSGRVVKPPERFF